MKTLCLVLLFGIYPMLACLGSDDEEGALITVTSPSANDIFTVGDQLEIEAVIHRPQLIRGVRFYINGSRVGLLDNSMPYQSDLIELTGSGVYEIQAVVELADGNLNESPITPIYAVPAKSKEFVVTDSITNAEEYIQQIYRDLLFREPSADELNFLLQELEFALTSREEILNSLMQSDELKVLLDAHNAYQMITGEWPDPFEFQAVVENYKSMKSDGDPTFSGSESNVSQGITDTYEFRIEKETLFHAYSTGSADIVAELKDAEGKVIANDDDSGVAFNFDLSVTLMPGEYVLSIRGFLGKSANYSIHTNLQVTQPIRERDVMDDGFLDYVIDSIYKEKQDWNPQIAVENTLKTTIDTLFLNRFEQPPKPWRSYENQRGVQAVGRVEDFASSLVRNLPLGYNFEGINLAEIESRDTAAYLVSTLLKEKPTRERIRPLLGLDFAEKIDSLIHEEDFRLRFEPQRTRVGESVSQPIDELSKQDQVSIFEDLTANSEGWKYSDWFGFVSDIHFPWVYQEKLGWTYLEQSEDDIWLWNEYVDAAYTRDDLFPNIYRYADSQWIYLFLEQDDGISIFNYTLNEWE